MARARCAYCTSPVESVWDGHGVCTDALVSGVSYEWCQHCRTRVPALLGELEPARAREVREALPALLPRRDARWAVN
jgi:hypothetical protein